MATKQTVTQFYSDLNALTNNKLENATNAQRLRYLNRALINQYKTIMTLCPSYDKHAKLTMLTTSQELDFPSDREPRSAFLLFYDDTYVQPYQSNYMKERSGKIFFSGDQQAGQDFFIEYRKEPSRYTDMANEVIETENLRALEILQTEVEHLRDIDLYQGQISGQAQGSQLRTDKIS